MISRYTLPEMADVWSERNKLQKWLDIEILAVEARAEKGLVPKEALEEIKEKAAFDPERVKEIEAVTQHDVVAFLTNVAENVGESSRYIHYGMTSSDILDTGLALQMRDAIDLIIEEAAALSRTLKGRALEFKDLPTVGRTHGVHAEPMLFGHKLALWTFEMARNLERLRRAREVINYGQISGAVGSYAHLEPYVEEYVCEKLGLKPAEVSTQILQRDRHAEYVLTLAITGSSLDKFALEVRGLQRTEVLEAEEPFARGQKGSSAMPHKRNPVLSENLCGLARIVRANALAALENVALWHERDISHSSAERVIFPDSNILVDFMLARLTRLLKNLVVYPEQVQANLNLSRGLVFSQTILLALVQKGLSRDEAYRLVQRAAMKVWEEGGIFAEVAAQDKDIGQHLTQEELTQLFDLKHHLRYVDDLFKRVFGG
jgi:adenylosuccinate lyase